MKIFEIINKNLLFVLPILKMNIFRFIADMLHLSAILILLYRIKKSRGCIGKNSYIEMKRLNFTYRIVLQDTRTLFTRLFIEILRSFPILYLVIQHSYENLLYFINSIHNLPHEI